MMIRKQHGVSIGIGVAVVCSLIVMGRPRRVAAVHDRALDRDRHALSVATAASFTAQEASGSAATGNRQAGEVVSAIPDEVVGRQGTAAAIPLKVSDAIYWQDLVKTLDNGRVRIRLMDSSLLNIGARSEMRIVQHDPQSQQTQVELNFGRLRGEVKKLTKSGSKFEVVTPTAVIGVVGTVFDLETDRESTRVHVIKGKVWVRHRDPHLNRQIVLRRGQQTNVSHAAPPSHPVRAPENPQMKMDAEVLNHAQVKAPQHPATHTPAAQTPNPSPQTPGANPRSPQPSNPNPQTQPRGGATSPPRSPTSETPSSSPQKPPAASTSSPRMPTRPR